jgi:hypothetical protein
MRNLEVRISPEASRSRYYDIKGNLPTTTSIIIDDDKRDKIFKTASDWLTIVIENYEMEVTDETIDDCLEWIDKAYSHGWILPANHLFAKYQECQKELMRVQEENRILVSLNDTLQARLKRKQISPKVKREFK